MNTMAAFEMGMANRDKPLMVFDWDEAARRILTAGAKSASASLRSDWEYTGDLIFQGGQAYNGHAYLASTWAVPELRLEDGDEELCYVMQDEAEKRWPGRDHSGPEWPQSALDILAGVDAPNIIPANH